MAEQTTLEMLDDFRRVRSRRTWHGRPLSVNRTKEIIIAKEDRPTAIAGYAPDVFPKLLAQFDPKTSREWRAWAITAIAGTQRPRINALLHLKWADIDFDADAGRGTIRWAPEFDKMGHEREQPMTQLAREAFYVALGWSRFAPAATDYVFYSPTARRHSKTDDGTYSVGAYWRMLRKAEDAAGVEHVRRRAAHGFRRMAAGNANAISGNPIEAMQWIGDRDLTMAQRYLKVRPARQQAIAGRMAVTESAERTRAPSSTTRKRGGTASADASRFSPTVTASQSTPTTENAPADADAPTPTETTTYDE